MCVFVWLCVRACVCVYRQQKGVGWWLCTFHCNNIIIYNCIIPKDSCVYGHLIWGGGGAGLEILLTFKLKFKTYVVKPLVVCHLREVNNLCRGKKF